jgi:hypothetical protein
MNMQFRRTNLDVVHVKALGEAIGEEIFVGAQVMALVSGPLHVLLLPAKITPVVHQAEDQVDPSFLRLSDYEVQSLKIFKEENI